MKMKNRRMLPLFVGVSLFSALNLSVLTPSASAQPDAAKPGKMAKKGRAKAVKGGVPKKMMAKIEEQLGKPLTEDQKLRLNTAYKTRTEAQKAAQAKFLSEVVNVTGITQEQAEGLTKRGAKAAAPGA